MKTTLNFQIVGVTAILLIGFSALLLSAGFPPFGLPYVLGYSILGVLIAANNEDKADNFNHFDNIENFDNLDIADTC